VHQDDSGKKDDDQDKTPAHTPEARKASGSVRLLPVKCPRCKGAAPFDLKDCPCCGREGEVPLAKFQQWIGEHPEDA
jgi:hypothetical protein